MGKSNPGANVGIIREHTGHRKQIMGLAWLDLVRKYRGASLGWLWAIIRPLVLLVVYWFVLKYGLRVSAVGDSTDLFPWLAIGLVVWLFTSGVVSDGVSSLKTYKYLVAKMKFPISVISTVVVLSNLFTHTALLALLMAYFAFCAGGVSIYWAQLPFYLLLLTAFSIMWTLLSSTLSAVSKDFAQFVRSAMRILFWLSGILWNVRGVGIDWLQTALLFNPITFFVEGFRGALIYHQWFWEDWRSLVGFTVTFGLISVLAVLVFKRTRKELVDIL